MFAVAQDQRNRNAGDNNKNLPDAGRGRRPDGIVCTLTERAILMGRAVQMDVRELYRGAKEEKDCDERN